MIDLQLSSGPHLTATQTTCVLYACLWHLLDGELVQDGQVWRDWPLGLYSPTLQPIRPATELDNAIWTVLQALPSLQRANQQPATI